MFTVQVAGNSMGQSLDNLATLFKKKKKKKKERERKEKKRKEKKRGEKKKIK